MTQNSNNHDLARATEFEQLLLGALMLDPGAIWKIDEMVSSSKFAIKAHAAWFQSIRDRVERQQDVDVFLVALELDGSGAPKPAGANWLAYIGDVVLNTPSAANVRTYARMVDKFHHDRLSAATGTTIMNVLKDTHTDVGERLDRAGGLLAGLEPQNAGKHTIGLQVALTRSVEALEERYSSDGKICMPYGFSVLDEFTQGSHRGDLVYIAGRPSMGKTALGMNFAEIFCEQGLSGLVCSMEMSAEQLAGRMITSIGQIDAQRYRSGKLVDEDWEKITYALGKMADHRLLIDETSQATPGSVRRAARRAKQEFGKLDFIMIDYLQLMQVDGKRGNHRADEITEISRQLKLIAKDLDVPVFVLAQLNRNLEQRVNKRPVMSDLRESGSLEQDADLILFIYRDEVYNPDSEFKGMAEIIIGKQRNGPVGTVNVAFLGAYSKFKDIAINHNY